MLVGYCFEWTVHDDKENLVEMMQKKCCICTKIFTGTIEIVALSVFNIMLACTSLKIKVLNVKNSFMFAITFTLY